MSWERSNEEQFNESDASEAVKALTVGGLEKRENGEKWQKWEGNVENGVSEEEGCTRSATPPASDGEYIRHWLTYVTRCWSKASPPERVKRLDAGLLIADDRVLNTSTYHTPTPCHRESTTSEPSTSEPTTRSR
uniref:HDC09961 n=1 Tax=Drosophila melanogaster TaxID=7227 RepID=Q6ILA3_DROME|nr:TPA_inf: HDC09961 [Drosophila melanogaster]